MSATKETAMATFATCCNMLKLGLKKEDYMHRAAQPAVTAPLATLAAYTIDLGVRTSLDVEDLAAFFQPGGLLGPTSNPPDLSTWKAITRLFPCSEPCAREVIGDDFTGKTTTESLPTPKTSPLFAVSSTIVAQALKDLAIEGLNRPQEAVLQMIAASEMKCERRHMAIPLHRLTGR